MGVIKNLEFDLSIDNPLNTRGSAVSIGQLLFEAKNDRDEKSTIILSHLENQYVELSLAQLRHIVAKLITNFQQKNITQGQTVMVIILNGCNELFSALHFLALASMGCRVFLPMFTQLEDFSQWIQLTGSSHILLPEAEVMSLKSHENEKQAISTIKRIAANHNLNTWDQVTAFGLIGLIQNPIPSKDQIQVNLVSQNFTCTDPDQEALIVTTSGSSGESKLVVYTHRAYYYNCIAWQEAGFYQPDKLGGTSFTPLFTHTMGIRALINALWTGYPVCLIITEWFIEKPEIVRYLLLKMKPAHITGGPAVYNTLIELFRIYPELKSKLSDSLGTLVSSGAKYSAKTCTELASATGLKLQNAFGTTETQQVTSTMLNSGSVFKEHLLGKPLPGVSLGLRKYDTGLNQYRLFVKSDFGCKYFLTKTGESTSQEYFDTGDLVVYDDQGHLYYAGRAAQDYFKDNFGVKIPLQAIHTYYQGLTSKIHHAEFYPFVNLPGLTALLFVDENNHTEGQVQDKKLLKKYAGIIEGINNRLAQKLDTFEYRHRHICRIALANQTPPLTGKGTISVKQISHEFRGLIERLTDSRQDATGVMATDQLYQETDQYTKYVSPLIGSMLVALKLNFTYHRAHKDSLYTYIKARETEVMDLVGGYGANLIGYNHPVLKQELSDFINSGKVALCNQLSIQKTAGILAEKLSLVVGEKTGRSYRVIFGNSGTEAVEIAVHHAYFEWMKRLEKLRDLQLQAYGSESSIDAAATWKRNLEKIRQAPAKIIGITNAFHGHSASARSMLGNTKHRTHFQALNPVVPVFLDDRDHDWQVKLNILLNESFIAIDKIVKEDGQFKLVPEKINTIIAALVEPVKGEGGVRVVNKDMLEKLAAQEFPLISDEIQCGLGRTGNFPEFESAQYYLFGKALGGGVEKIAAVMIDTTHFQSEFNEYYVSTFANGELAAQAAITFLNILEADKLTERSKNIGTYLQQQLHQVQQRHPSVIKEIVGKGLMLGIYFHHECAGKSILLRMLIESEKAGYVFAGWFTNRHHIRILPTLSAPDALRIEPSAYYSKSEADRFCQALEDLCLILKEGRTYDLFSFMMDDDPFEREQANTELDHYHHHLETPDSDAVKVAFIAHFVFPLQELRMLEPDLRRASDTGLRILFRSMQTLMEGKHVQIMAAHLFNRKVHFSFYALALDSAGLEYLHKSGQRRFVVARIQKAVDFAAAKGAKIISLGGYTSILTNNGLALTEPEGTRIITGNTLTAASGLVHLERILRSRLAFNKPNKIAIIGYTGNIGRIITGILAEQADLCESLLLISRSRKPEKYLQEITGDNPKVQIECSTQLSEAKSADVIIISTNTNDPIVLKHHISSHKPVIISDLSVPSAVSEEVKMMGNVTILPFAAYVGLSEDKNVVISSYSPPGTVFCCAGEPILLALENCNQPLKGRITPEAVKTIISMASKYGFFNSINSMVSYKSEVAAQ